MDICRILQPLNMISNRNFVVKAIFANDGFDDAKTIGCHTPVGQTNLSRLLSM